MTLSNKRRMTENLGSKDLAPTVADYIDAGDVANLDGNFSLASEQYESAYALLGEQRIFEFEKTRDCINKLISVYSHLDKGEKVNSLAQTLKQIENTQSVMSLQASAEFFRSRNQPAKAASTFAKALQIARSTTPVNTPLINHLKFDYEEQRKLAIESGLKSCDDLDFLPSDLERKTESVAVNKNRVMRGVGSVIEEKKQISPLLFLDWVKAPIFLLIVSLVLLSSVGQLIVSANVTPKTTVMDLPESFAGIKFFSCDQKSGLLFEDDEHCAMLAPGGRTFVQYKALSDWTKNSSVFFRGFLRRKEYWFSLQNENLVDQNGTVFFRPTAPEKTIIAKMWFYARCAQDQYKERKLYPSSLDRCRRTYKDFDYINPFTGKSDSPSLLTQGAQNAPIDLCNRGLTDRQWRPGAILCLQQDTKHLMVQGFDSQGKPFVSSDPSSYFAINLADGKVTTEEPKSQIEVSAMAESQKNLENAQSTIIYISNEARVASTVEALRRLPQIVFWFAFFVSAGGLIFGDKLKNSKRVKQLSRRTICGSVIALTIFYAIAYLG